MATNPPTPTHATAAGRMPVVRVIDDEQVLRDALSWLLRSRRLLCETYDSAEAFIAWQDQQRAPWPDCPTCLLLDMRMPGMGGMALFERLAVHRLLTTAPVIFLTGHGDVPTAVAAVKRGAFDFVEKPFSNNAMVDRIEQALASSTAALTARVQHDSWQLSLAELTAREHEVMRLVAEGRPNKLIADALQVSVRTVEVHRARVFEKLGVKSAVELANRLNHPG